MNIGVRPGRTEDFKALVELWERAWTAAMPSLDFAARRSWFCGHLHELTEAGAHLLVACDASDVVGFCTVEPIGQVLDQLAVAPEQQGRGVATSLLDAAKLVSTDGLSLSVNTENARAVSLYLRNGFAMTGNGTNPRSGLPILRMRWQP